MAKITDLQCCNSMCSSIAEPNNVLSPFLSVTVVIDACIVSMMHLCIVLTTIVEAALVWPMSFQAYDTA